MIELIALGHARGSAGKRAVSFAVSWQARVCLEDRRPALIDVTGSLGRQKEVPLADPMSPSTWSSSFSLDLGTSFFSPLLFSLEDFGL